MDEPAIPAAERHYTIREIARMWGLTESTVYRVFVDMPGVLKISFPGLLAQRKRKPKVTLRVPESVLNRVYAERTRGFELHKRRSST